MRRIVLLVLLVAAACDKSAFVAPAGSTITLFTTSTVLGVNGEALITALVLESGQFGDTPTTPGQPTTPSGTRGGTPVNDGTLVAFSTTLGFIEPEARTTNGLALARLLGDGRSGTATVTAVSGAATKTLEIKIGSAGATRTVVTANPPVLPFGGGTTFITARVEDAGGNGLMGVPVNFSSSTGFFSLTAAITDERGLATTTFTTTSTATVTAATGSAAGQSGSVTVSVSTSGSGLVLRQGGGT